MADAACSQRHAGVTSAVVEVDSVAVGANGLAAWKDNVLYISATFIRGLRAEHPGVTTLETNLRMLEIEEGEAKAIDAS